MSEKQRDRLRFFGCNEANNVTRRRTDSTPGRKAGNISRSRRQRKAPGPLIHLCHWTRRASFGIDRSTSGGGDDYARAKVRAQSGIVRQLLRLRRGDEDHAHPTTSNVRHKREPHVRMHPVWPQQNLYRRPYLRPLEAECVWGPGGSSSGAACRWRHGLRLLHRR